MDRLKYHEFGKQLQIFKLLRTDFSEDDRQLQRKRMEDRLRDEKIRACTDQLRTNKNFTVGDFLESLANETVLPNIGMNIQY